MKKIITSTIALGIITTLSISCNKDDDNNNNNTLQPNALNLTINGLEDLGANYVYEGWVLVNDIPITTGRFSVNTSGELSQSSFNIDKSTLDAATLFILTIEPSIGDLPEPSNVHILAGEFSGNNGTMTIDHPAALGNDFNTANGQFILATPSTPSMLDENEGVWFLDNSSGNPEESLILPTLPSGWIYEGWAIIDGKPISSGKFMQTNIADLDNNPYKGPDSTPPFPGEDFITGNSNGVDLTLNQHIEKVVISIEPIEDNSPNPFTLKPLLSEDLTSLSPTHSVLNLQQNLAFPTGTFSRQ